MSYFRKHLLNSKRNFKLTKLISDCFNEFYWKEKKAVVVVEGLYFLIGWLCS